MKQTIYHGSYMAVTEPRIIQGRFTKDFGEGFYCTILAKQAIRWTLKTLTFISSEDCAYED